MSESTIPQSDVRWYELLTIFYTTLSRQKGLIKWLVEEEEDTFLCLLSNAALPSKSLFYLITRPPIAPLLPKGALNWVPTAQSVPPTAAAASAWTFEWIHVLLRLMAGHKRI